MIPSFGGKCHCLPITQSRFLWGIGGQSMSILVTLRAIPLPSKSYYVVTQVETRWWKPKGTFTFVWPQSTISTRPQYRHNESNDNDLHNLDEFRNIWWIFELRANMLLSRHNCSNYSLRKISCCAVQPRCSENVKANFCFEFYYFKPILMCET